MNKNISLQADTLIHWHFAQAHTIVHTPSTVAK